MQRSLRVAYLVSHPIQYQVPLLRRLAEEPGIDLTVLYGSDLSVRSYQDEGFGVPVAWDVPLLDGYRSEFLPVRRDTRTIGPTSPWSRGLLGRLQRGVDGQPFDVLWMHGYASVNSLQAMVAAKALGIPVLLRAESWLQDRERSPVKLAGKRIFFNWLATMVNGVLPIGTFNSEYWTHYFADRVPQFLVPYAVDNAYFQQRSRQAALRRGELQAELGLDASRPVILFASKLQERKHCDHLIEAYRRLVEARSVPARPYLVIVGDGEQRASLQQRAEGMEGIRFCGFRNQSQLPRFFDLATVFVLPSRHEPWGLIVNEAMNAGRAVIVTDSVGCHPDLVRDGVQGLVYPTGDIDALTSALERILWTPGLAQTMGEAALERIRQWSFEEDIAGLRRAFMAVTGRAAA